jgi:carbamoyltransferase
LIKNGEILAAAEEERFRRIKHWAGFPAESIRYCLREADAKLSDVEHIAINSNPRANFGRRLGYALFHRPDFKLLTDRLRNQQKRNSVRNEIEIAFPGETFSGIIHRIEHHLAHLGSAFLVSPFSEAVVLSVDGFGDFSSGAWGTGRGETIDIDGRVWFPHSLGVFYQAMTQFLGFPHYGDEYKVMGLAPYGEPSFLPQMRRIVLLQVDGSYALDTSYFRHHKEKVPYEWTGGAPYVGPLYSSSLEHLLGPSRKTETLDQRYLDIARSTQSMYEEAFFHLLDRLHERYKIDNLALAGGCAMNSVANGKIRRLSPFKRVYIQSAAGDAGGAIGAAMHVWQKVGRKSPRPGIMQSNGLSEGGITRGMVMDHAYFGPRCNDEEVRGLLAVRASDLARSGCRTTEIQDDGELFSYIATSIAKGDVVGWFQGRMEWGPRALGNRSILGDPRRSDMKDILNRKIKRRESFRPFAPSVQREHVSEWFEEEGDVPFMMQVFQIKEGKRSIIPAVTHVDGSGRLQTVHKETNPRYWGLIEAFRQITGVPMLLNTSFNENEPVVCQPVEALDCFMRTRMDVLVLGNRIIEREP